MVSPGFLIAALVRILLVVLFPFSALDKIFDWKAALKQANSSFLPGGPALLVLAVVVELVAPFCIIFAWHDRLAALILAAFCAITALLYHEFWKYGDFWARENSKGRADFWDFLKNFGLVGGLLLITFGAPMASLGSIASHPLASSPAYASATTAPTEPTTRPAGGS
ncbi:MAG TPA: DoxX family membrane protein [Beijerinckiaceae bacterium]|nr:DoxX family membrane protein [Beijerinckiaceae bacterium]